VIAGTGTPLFPGNTARHRLELRSVEQLSAGKIAVAYDVL
jgi:hypothetical protein